MGKMMGVMSSEIRTLRSLYTFKYQIFFAPNTDQSSTDKGEPWVKPGKTLGQARKNLGKDFILYKMFVQIASQLLKLKEKKTQKHSTCSKSTLLQR
jgi:hypothetical protein